MGHNSKTKHFIKKTGHGFEDQYVLIDITKKWRQSSMSFLTYTFLNNSHWKRLILRFFEEHTLQKIVVYNKTYTVLFSVI